MKNLKKVLAVLIAAVMVFAMGSIAWAGITLTNTIEKETYTIYKMMDLETNDDNSAYKYTINDAWTGFFTGTGAGAAYVTISETDGHVEWADDTADMVVFAQMAEAYAVANDISGTAIVAEGSSVTFDVDNGYYLITSTLGTQAMVYTNPEDPDVTITEKNPEDTIEKEVQEDSTGDWGENNDAQVGDTVNFHSTATIQPYTRNVYIHDTMDSGLTYNNDVAIEGLTAGTDYVVLATPQTGDTFTIQITDEYIARLDTVAELVLTYTAVLNEGAVVTGDDGTAIVDQNNKTSITYGDKQSVEDQTTTTTHKFSVFKHASNSDDNLAGAVFTLKKNNADVSLIKIDDNNYRVANGEETGAITSFTTVDDGDIVIWGVDADDDYSLEETEAPSGYNKLESNVEVTVDSGNATRIDVENNTGSTLPSTGGIGTTIFYIIGGCVVLAAVIFLIVRSKKSSAK